MNMILPYSKFFALTLFIWASHISNNNNEFTNARDSNCNLGYIRNGRYNRLLSANEQSPQGSAPDAKTATQEPSTSQNVDLNIDFEQKLKELKEIIKERVGSVVELDALSENVKSYLEKLDSSIESRIQEEVNQANAASSSMENVDARSQVISNYSQNYTIITPPVLLLLLTALTSDRCKKHLANIILTALLVIITYIFLKLKKMDDNKGKTNSGENTDNGNNSGKKRSNQ
ncbi:Plasmodium exported protein, unknown function [Plasmodium ovale]|uniref:Uncharacterized protein n=2 Tax=Plasmodium ovale TaxID=36330 RepID=A0A1A8W9P3_PLAOA|nr:hypothetical protein POVCU2_0045280 [Plasmodium ovale curtisi]SBT00436.1 hypothetical protein POVCU1_059960 [Plasmodium ovale curtisi]SBT83007.1 Plasmodium exported protein, unknown function [Plasmodium ovale]